MEKCQICRNKPTTDVCDICKNTIECKECEYGIFAKSGEEARFFWKILQRTLAARKDLVEARKEITNAS